MFHRIPAQKRRFEPTHSLLASLQLQCGDQRHPIPKLLSIAKAAKASNETLYRWYGDKRGLFEAMVRDNADDIKTTLERAINEASDPSETLRRVAPLLLTMLLGERAILLNRAAAADPSGELGAAIAAGGRDAVQPLITSLIHALCDGKDLDVPELTEGF